MFFKAGLNVIVSFVFCLTAKGKPMRKKTYYGSVMMDRFNVRKIHGDEFWILGRCQNWQIFWVSTVKIA